MAVSRLKKEQSVAQLTKMVDQSVSLLLAENTGVESNDMNNLRREARLSDVGLIVVKNTLSQRVLGNDKRYKIITDDLKNPILIAFSLTNLSSAAKLLGNFAKKNDRLVIKAMVIEGERYDAASLKYVMGLPTREQAIAMIAHGIQTPVVRFAYVLQELYGRFARVIDAVEKQKQS